MAGNLCLVPSTDVLTLLIDLVSHGRLGSHPMTSLTFQTGKGSKSRKINVVERVQAIGCNKCQGLIGLHNFSGADWGGKFVGISKMRWVREHLKLSDDDPAIRCFGELGNNSLSLELVGSNLPEQIRPL